MEVRNGSVYDIISVVASVESVAPQFRWGVILHTPAGEHILDDVQSEVIVRDYASNFSDSTTLNVMMGSGTLVSHVYPYKGNLTIEMAKVGLVKGVVEIEDASIKTVGRRYRAILVDQTSKGMVASNTQTTDDTDTANRELVQFQLIDPLLDKIRVRTISGIFAGTWENVIRACLKTDLRLEPYTSTADVTLTQDHMLPVLAGVTMVTPDNPNGPKQLLVPVGTKVTDFAGWVQDTRGLYKHSLGTYIERGMWYIWGLHDTGRFQKSDRTLTVAIADVNTLPSTDNSYQLENKHVTIIATGNVNHNDQTESRLQNEGNGVRYLNADKVVDNYSVTKGGVTTVTRADNMVEYVVETREDGNDLAPYSGKPTGNHYHEMSKLNARRGAVLTVQWNCSDPDILRPGMPVKVLYTDSEDVTEVYGILVGCQHAYSQATGAYTDRTIRCNSALNIWVDRDV